MLRQAASASRSTHSGEASVDEVVRVSHGSMRRGSLQAKGLYMNLYVYGLPR